MKTVKDYLDSGLALVNGDVCQTDLNKGLRVDARLYPRLHRFDRDWHEYASIGSTSFDDHEIVEFAWRPISTLPDNQKFQYETSSSIVSGGEVWRPLLSQLAPEPAGRAAIKLGEDKPLYTQAMADAGELPPVGSEFAVSSLIGECLLINRGDVIARFSTGVMSVHQHECKPIDTRTPKQKAIEEVTGEWPMADKSTIEVMFDLGYRKEQVK